MESGTRLYKSNNAKACVVMNINQWYDKKNILYLFILIIDKNIPYVIL